MMRLILLLHMDRKTGYVGIAGMIQPVETIKIIIGQKTYETLGIQQAKARS
jgi:hypothetical protein